MDGKDCNMENYKEKVIYIDYRLFRNCFAEYNLN